MKKRIQLSVRQRATLTGLEQVPGWSRQVIRAVTKGSGAGPERRGQEGTKAREQRAGEVRQK